MRFVIDPWKHQFDKGLIIPYGFSVVAFLASILKDFVIEKSVCRFKTGKCQCQCIEQFCSSHCNGGEERVKT